MAGTVIGGAKAAKTNIERYGEGFYQRIGAIGGKLSKSGGFASQKTSPDGRTGQDRAKAAGSIGGKRSKRGHKFIKHENGVNYYTCNITGQLRKYREVYESTGDVAQAKEAHNKVIDRARRAAQKARSVSDKNLDLDGQSSASRSSQVVGKTQSEQPNIATGKARQSSLPEARGTDTGTPLGRKIEQQTKSDPLESLKQEARKYGSAEEFRKNLIYNDDIIIHQTGKNTADKIKSEGFKAGKETGLGEKRSEVYGMSAYDWMNHKKFSKDTYARDGSDVAEVAIDTKGLKIIDRTKQKFTDEEYVKGIHKQIPDGYDGVKVGYGNGVNEVLLKPEVANARRFNIDDLYNQATQSQPPRPTATTKVENATKEQKVDFANYVLTNIRKHEQINSVGSVLTSLRNKDYPYHKEIMQMWKKWSRYNVGKPAAEAPVNKLPQQMTREEIAKTGVMRVGDADLPTYKTGEVIGDAKPLKKGNVRPDAMRTQSGYIVQYEQYKQGLKRANHIEKRWNEQTKEAAINEARHRNDSMNLAIFEHSDNYGDMERYLFGEEINGHDLKLTYTGKTREFGAAQPSQPPKSTPVQKQAPQPTKGAETPLAKSNRLHEEKLAKNNLTQNEYAGLHDKVAELDRKATELHSKVSRATEKAIAEANGQPLSPKVRKELRAMADEWGKALDDHVQALNNVRKIDGEKLIPTKGANTSPKTSSSKAADQSQPPKSPIESLKQEATPKYMQDKVTPEGYFTEGRYKDSAYPKNFVAKADIPHTGIKAGDRVALIKGRDGRFDAILSKKYKEKSTGYTISRESFVDPKSFTSSTKGTSPELVPTPVKQTAKGNNTPIKGTQSQPPKSPLKTEPIKVYRGGDVTGLDPNKVTDRGISVATNKENAQWFGGGYDPEYAAKSGKGVQELELSPSAKILDVNDVPKETLDGFKKLNTDNTTLKEEAALMEYARREGYDAVDVAPWGEAEIRVLNPDILQVPQSPPVQKVETPVESKTLYHGTAKGNVFDKFEIKNDRVGVGSNANHQGNAIYLTDSKQAADYFSTQATRNAKLRNKNLSLEEATGGKDVVGDIYKVSLKKGAKVKSLDSRPNSAEAQALQAEGYDAISFPEEAFGAIEGSKASQIKANTVVVFDPNMATINKPKKPFTPISQPVDNLPAVVKQVTKKQTSEQKIAPPVVAPTVQKQTPAPRPTKTTKPKSPERLVVGGKSAEVSSDGRIANIDEFVKQQVAEQEAEPEKTGRISKLKRVWIDALSPAEDNFRQAVKDGKLSQETLDDIIVKNGKSIRSGTAANINLVESGLVDLLHNKSKEDYDNLGQTLIAIHAKDLRANGIETGRDAALDEQIVAKYGEQFKADIEQFRDVANYVLDKSVASQLISKETADMLKKKYPNYVPMNRVMEELENTGSFNSSQIASIGKQTVVRKIKGSKRTVENPIESMISKVQDMTKQSLKNEAAITWVDALKKTGDAELIEGTVKPGKSTISVIRNGNKEIYSVEPEMEAAAKGLTKEQMGTITNAARKVSRVFKTGTTGLNLPFIVTNLARDQQNALLNQSKGELETFKAIPTAIMETLGHGKLYQEAVRNGAISTSFDLTKPNLKLTAANIRKRGSSLGALSKIEDVIGRSEEYTRIQQYKATKEYWLEQGMSESQAQNKATIAAQQNSADFARAGDLGQILNAWLPYTNAGVQGTRSTLRAAKNNPVRYATKAGAMLVMPTIMTALWNTGDEERKKIYDDISENDKQASFIVITPWAKKNEEGKWEGIVKIPKPPGISALLYPVEKGVASMNGLDPVGFKDIVKGVLGFGSPLGDNLNAAVSTVTPQAIKPAVEATINRNLFTNRDIVPYWLKDKPANEQAYKGSSGTARMISSLTGVSPIKVEHMIRGYGGELGLQGLNAADNALNKAGLIPKEQIGGISIPAGFKKRFTEAYDKPGSTIQRGTVAGASATAAKNYEDAVAGIKSSYGGKYAELTEAEVKELGKTDADAKDYYKTLQAVKQSSKTPDELPTNLNPLATSIYEKEARLTTDGKDKWKKRPSANKEVNNTIKSWLPKGVDAPRITNETTKKWADYEKKKAEGTLGKLEEESAKKTILRSAYNSVLTEDEKDLYTLSKDKLLDAYDRGVINDQNIDKALKVERQLFDAGLISTETLAKKLGLVARGYKGRSGGRGGRGGSGKIAKDTSVAFSNALQSTTLKRLNSLLAGTQSGGSTSRRVATSKPVLKKISVKA